MPKPESPKEVSMLINDLDLFIALRKRVRSCAKHILSNFLTYSRLSLNFKLFTVVVDGVNVLKNVQEALKDPERSSF